MISSITKYSKHYWASVIVVLTVWQVVSYFVDQEIIIPSLLSIGREFLRIVTTSSSWRVISQTFGRIGFTFLLDLFLALLLGIPAGLHKSLEQSLLPIESIVRTIPTMGVVILSLIWLDTEITPIFVCSLIIFPILYRSVVDGIKNIDPKLVDFHNVHQVSFKKRLRYFYIPSVSSSIKTGTIASLGLGFKVMVTAEVLSQPEYAIGTIFQIERSQLNTAGVMAWCVFMIIVSSGFEYLIQNFHKIRGRGMRSSGDVL